MLLMGDCGRLQVNIDPWIYGYSFLDNASMLSDIAFASSTEALISFMFAA